MSCVSSHVYHVYHVCIMCVSCVSWVSGAAAGEAASVVAGRETVSVVPDASDRDGRYVPLPHRTHPGAVPHTRMYLHRTCLSY